MAPASKRRRWIVCGIVVALGLVAVVAWWRRPEPIRAAASTPDVRRVALAVERGEAAPVGEEALPEAVQRYLENTVYPPTSGRLTEGNESLLHPNQRYEGFRAVRETLGDERGVVSYEFTADRYDITEDQQVDVWLEVRRGSAPLELAWIDGHLQREGRAGMEGDPVALDFRRDGVRWEAELPLEDVADHYGFLVAEVRFGYGEGAAHEDTLRFFHTPADRIPARFTGDFQDYVRDGGLFVEVGLDVRRAGFYRLDANFYDARGAPAAFAAFKGELDEGQRMVPLIVYGKVLRDAAASAPYTVRELRGYRFIEGGYPDRETIPPSPHQWTSGRYALDEFTEEAWTSEHKERMVELMMQDEAAGIPVEVPPLAGAEESAVVVPPAEGSAVVVPPAEPASPTP